MFKYDIFISYSRKDTNEVRTFIELLKARIPSLSVWFDISEIDSGDEFDEKIVTAINLSKYVIFALSDNSIQSKWAKQEVMYAVNVGKKVIPLLLTGAELKDWFLFTFGRLDYVNIGNAEQVEKMVCCLSKWTEKPIAHTETDNVSLDQLCEFPKTEKKTGLYIRAKAVIISVSIAFFAIISISSVNYFMKGNNGTDQQVEYQTINSKEDDYYLMQRRRVEEIRQDCLEHQHYQDSLSAEIMSCKTGIEENLTIRSLIYYRFKAGRIVKRIGSDTLWMRDEVRDAYRWLQMNTSNLDTLTIKDAPTTFGLG